MGPSYFKYSWAQWYPLEIEIHLFICSIKTPLQFGVSKTPLQFGVSKTPLKFGVSKTPLHLLAHAYNQDSTPIWSLQDSTPIYSLQDSTPLHLLAHAV
jgi:hypothetical protein